MKREPLHAERNDREMHLVEVLVEEHRDLEDGARRPLRHVHSTVSLQAEQRPQPFLAATRRAKLDQRLGDVPTRIPQSVGRSRRDDDDVAGAQRAPAESEPEAKLTRHALEPLPLARMHVARYEAARLDEQLSRNTIVRPLAEDDALSTDRIVDLVYALVDRSI